MYISNEENSNLSLPPLKKINAVLIVFNRQNTGKRTEELKITAGEKVTNSRRKRM